MSTTRTPARPSVTALRARLRRRGRQRGTAVFIVVLMLTMLLGIGMFAARSAALATASSGNIRQATQTRYAADYAILLATAKLSDGGSQSYLNQAANTPVAKAQNCEAQGTLARPTCYKFFYGEIEAELAVQGQSIFDVDGHLIRPVREEWRPLLNAVDEIG